MEKISSLQKDTLIKRMMITSLSFGSWIAMVPIKDFS
jgi:hypothetical protein